MQTETTELISESVIILSTKKSNKQTKQDYIYNSSATKDNFCYDFLSLVLGVLAYP